MSDGSGKQIEDMKAAREAILGVVGADELDDLIFTLGDAADGKPGRYWNDVLMRQAQDALIRLRAAAMAARAGLATRPVVGRTVDGVEVRRGDSVWHLMRHDRPLRCTEPRRDGCVACEGYAVPGGLGGSFYSEEFGMNIRLDTYGYSTLAAAEAARGG